LISLIICSKNSVYLNKLLDNISKTIGCQYEILLHDNLLECRSLCSVYNDLVQRAKYPYVLFLHEDMEFYTVNWGLIIEQTLVNESVGLVGLSGTIYKSKYQGVWSAAKTTTYRVSSECKDLPINQRLSFFKVAVIDGCFMAARKKIFEQYRFDERLVGFHGYDLDLSIQIGQDYLVVVTNGIKFNHLSEGNQNLDWLLSSLYIHNKWKKVLPLSIEKIDEFDRRLSDYLAAQNIYNVIYELRYSYQMILKYYILFVIKYFMMNRLRYTKKTLYYFLGS
jgi:hypothetical protein